MLSQRKTAISRLLIVASLSIASIANAKSQWKPLPNGTFIDSQIRSVLEQGDSDDTPRLRITDAIGSKVIRLPGGVETVRHGLRLANAMSANTISSDWLYVPRLSDPANGTIIIVFGHAFASDPGSIRILRKTSNGRIDVIFSDDRFQIEALSEDMAGLKLIGRRSFSQTSDECLTTYDPSSIIRIRPKGKAKYSGELSQRYNIETGYVWAGPMSREDIRVNRCFNPAHIVDK